MINQNLLFKILYSINLVSLIGTTCIFFFSSIFTNKPEIDTKKEFNDLYKEVISKTKTPSFKLKKMILNLPSSSSRRLRYLEIETHIEPFEERQIPLLEKNEHIIYDKIITIASKMNTSDFHSITGKINFENHIIDEINNINKKKLAKKIHFTKFLLQ